MGFIFGFGYGAWQSVDWALGTDVLPSSAHRGKDMGIFHMASGIPQIVASPISGSILSLFQLVGNEVGMKYLGWQVIFVITTFFFILSSFGIARIKDKPKPEAEILELKEIDKITSEQ